MEVCKEVFISTAHMLSGHDGLCANLHGHNYRIQVSVGSAWGLCQEGSSARMVIDFKELKKAISENIDSVFDHAIVFSSAEYRKAAEEELLAWAKKWNMRYFEMPSGKRSTAEDMSTLFAKALSKKLNRPVQVRVWETEGSVATSDTF